MNDTHHPPRSVYYSDESVHLYHGDCLDVMASLPDAFVDAIVTDPPYGLGFMGKEWDALPPGLEWAEQCLRVLKPGGYLLAFGGTRTWHRLVVSVEDAGFEIRDSIAWLYGSGFPKGLDVSKAIDKAAGAERVRNLVATKSGNAERRGEGDQGATYGDAHGGFRDESAPITDAAKQWQGWGTALKPAFEPVVVGRKPLVGTVAANVLTHGTGALNIDGCRVGDEPRINEPMGSPGKCYGGYGATATATATATAGRWPTNVVLDESQAHELDAQSGNRPSGGGPSGTYPATGLRGNSYTQTRTARDGDDGGPSRYFPVMGREGEATADKRYTDSGATDFAATPDARREPVERSAMFPTFRYEAKAPGHERPRDGDTAHPTVKPLDLMRWLVRLVTPPGGTVLDPFLGSGTTAEACIVEGFQCIGIERDETYLPLIVARLSKPIAPVLDFGVGA